MPNFWAILGLQMGQNLGGGLRALEIPEAIPGGVLTPGGFNHAWQALGEMPD